MMKFIFGMQINIEVFYKLILLFWLCVTRHPWITQNKKFAYLRNISRKAWVMKLIFCLQLNTKVFCEIIVSLWVWVAGLPKVSRTISLQYFCNISRKMWRMKLIICLQINIKGFFKKKLEIKLIFCMQVNIKHSHKLISKLWASMFSAKAWSNICKVLKVVLQYLYNISKKRLGMEFIFSMHINIKVSSKSGKFILHVKGQACPREVGNILAIY